MVSIVSGYVDTNKDNVLSAGDTVTVGDQPASIIQNTEGNLYVDLNNNGEVDVEVDAAENEPDFEIEQDDVADFEEKDDGANQSSSQQDEADEEQSSLNVNSSEETEVIPFDILGIFALLRELIDLSTDRMQRDLENFGENLETQIVLLKVECAKIKEEGRHAATQMFISGGFSIASGLASFWFIRGVKPSSKDAETGTAKAGINSSGTNKNSGSVEVHNTASSNKASRKSNEDTIDAAAKLGETPKHKETPKPKEDTNQVEGKSDAPISNPEPAANPKTPEQEAAAKHIKPAVDDSFLASTKAQAVQSITQGSGQIIAGPFKILEDNARSDSTFASGQRSVESQIASLIQSWYSEAKEDRSAMDQLIKDTCRSIESAR